MHSSQATRSKIDKQSMGLSAAQVRSALVSDNNGLDLYMLSYHAGVTMQVLAEMAATPLFYQRQTCHDSFCS